VVENTVVENTVVENTVVDGPLPTVARVAICDPRCRPGRVRVWASKPVIAPDAHNPNRTQHNGITVSYPM